MRVEALVTAQVLLWARKTAGYSLQEAANRAHVKIEQLESWEQGEQRPSVSQLRKLAKLYKRPLAVFYLPEAPLTFKALHDYRKLPEQAVTVESPELRFEIRRAHERRQVALALYDELGETPPTFQMQVSLASDPEHVANQIRDLLGITYAEQIKWKDAYEARSWWRDALERIGVLVFQATDVALSEMRGFSINEKPLPVLAVNSKDQVRGRIFTMLHEFTHLLLNEDSLCTLDETHKRTSVEQRVEVFCNRVAGAALIPRYYLEMENEVSGKQHKSDWSNETIEALAKKYSVSREALLRRLLTLGYTTEAFYRKRREEFLQEYEELSQKAQSGFVQPDRAAINAAGPSFVRLVLSSYYQDKITAVDVSDFLNIRLKHLSNVERMVRS